MHSTRDAHGYGLNQGVLEALLVPLAMVMRDVLRHSSSEMAFPDRNDSVKPFFRDGSYEPLRERIRVRSLIRRLHDANPDLSESFADGGAPLRIAVADQHAARLSIHHRKRPHGLAHKCFIRTGRGS